MEHTPRRHRFPVRTFTAEEIERIKYGYITDKKSLLVLGREFKARAMTISRVLKSAGVILRKGSVHKLPTDTKACIVRELADGTPIKEIQRKIGVTDTRIYFVRNEYISTHDDDTSRAIKQRFAPFQGKSTKNIRREALKRWQKGARVRGKQWDLSIDDLQALFDKQQGRCYYTGVPMISPTSNRELKLARNNVRLCSLDRLDSSRGYTRDNVAFCCCAMNLGKSDWSEFEFTSLISEIGTTNTIRRHAECVAKTEDLLVA